MSPTIETSDKWIKKSSKVFYKCCINSFNDSDNTFDVSYYGLNKHEGYIFVKTANISESQIVSTAHIKLEFGDYVTIENPEDGEETIYINGTEIFVI